MTENAESKVSLIEEFKGLTTKQWLAIIGSMIASIILTMFGFALSCLGFLVIAVLLYMVPHMLGVISPKIKAVVGVVFLVLILLIGTFGYTDSVKDYDEASSTIDPSISEVTYENGIVTVVSSDDSLNLRVIYGILGINFSVTGLAESAETTEMKYSDGVYSASVKIRDDCIQILQVQLEKGEDTFISQYEIVRVNHADMLSICFMGAAQTTGLIGLMYFVLLIFSTLMRRSAMKARDKMEAEGRLYPEGYSKCKECGTMVLPGEITCRKCGAPIEVPEDVKVLHKKDFFECSECGTEVPIDAKVCPKCGAKFDEDEETVIQHADGTVDSSSETFECSECGKEVPANAKRCPYCGAEFDEDEE